MTGTVPNLIAIHHEQAIIRGLARAFAVPHAKVEAVLRALVRERAEGGEDAPANAIPSNP